ncbi:MAG: hypothetical protein DRJ10_01320 [Bacteroidetes bacterium]|nr:MAG: hypothetical protein DRJ10_01320 [Bacteroidota bacterium]
MSWITKLFGRENSNDGNETDVLEKAYNDGNELAGLEEVFVDSTPPATERTPQHTSKLLQFFNRDFPNQGFQDGYSNHSKEKLQQCILKIKSDFRFEIDQLISKKRDEILRLAQSRVEVEGISDETVAKIDLQLNHHTNQITELESQKALSSEDEGWVMKVQHEYQNGYANGTKQYFDENKVLGFEDIF